MKLLLINYEYPPIGGGAANACQHIAAELAQLGHTPVVLTAHFKKQDRQCSDNGIILYRCPALRRHADQSNMLEKASYIASAMLHMPKIIRKHDIEGVIVFFSLPCGPLGLFAHYWAGIPYIISLRGGDVPGNEIAIDKLHSFLAPIRRLILSKSLAVISNSKGLKQLSERADPIPVAVIPNGVDSDFFYPMPKQKGRAFQFLFIGRFQSQKNLFYLLDNLAQLSQKSLIPFTVKLVGDGPLKAELVQYAEILNISNRIEWQGWVDKASLSTIYQQADCFINPSLYEGMPNTVLEAMASGLPIIASNVLGNDELVRHGETGYLFNLDRPDEFQQSLKDLLENPDKARRFGLTGRRRVEIEYSWHQVAQEYIALFK